MDPSKVPNVTLEHCDDLNDCHWKSPKVSSMVHWIYFVFFSVSLILLEVLLYECPHKAFCLTTKKKFAGKIIGLRGLKIV